MLYQFENILFDHDKGVVKKLDNEVSLTRLQRKFLLHLIENPRVILSRTTLMETIWGRVVTKNSIDQVILALRNILEDDPAQPKYIVTHFGQGVSFEAEAVKLDQETSHTIESNHQEPEQKQLIRLSMRSIAYLLAVLALLTFGWKLHGSFQQEHLQESLKDKKLLVLPIKFQGEDIDQISQKGISDSFKSSFNKLDSEGDVVFDESIQTTAEAINKHKKLESELVVVSSRVIRNGDTYEATIELTKGSESLGKTKLKANNLDELLKQQIVLLSNYRNVASGNSQIQSSDQELSKRFIEASGYKKIGDLKEANRILKDILENNPDYVQARLELAGNLLLQKKIDQALIQYNLLKASPAYKFMGTEIELGLAEVQYQKKEYTRLIEELSQFQAAHLTLGEIKKSKIKIMIAKAYLALGDVKKALTFYKQALVGIDDKLYPDIYAMSLYGQANVRLNNSNDNNIMDLYKKALAYAKEAADLRIQALVLSKMANVALSQFDWEHALLYINQSLEMMEFTQDKTEIANGMSTLVSMLNLRGQFTRAKQVNARLGKIARETKSDRLMLIYMHFEAVLAMNMFDWKYAREMADKEYALAQSSDNYPMLLNSAFVDLELRLLHKRLDGFKDEWDRRSAMIKKIGFERFQIYLDLFLGRYYKQKGETEKAIEIVQKVSEQAKAAKDFKVLVDAQNQLAEIYLPTDPLKVLHILNDMEQYNPHPNPYLELKAKALNKLGRKKEALTIIQEAKKVYYESWNEENQALLDSLQNTR
ncbi:MAG: winged helix-turn-helix domain-containing protein [bacterium]